MIKIWNKRLMYPEMLFKPHFDGINKIVYDSIMKCDLDLRKELYGNIVLPGGTLKSPGKEEMEREIATLASILMKVKGIAYEERKYAVWVGGSILVSIVTFPQKIISK